MHITVFPVSQTALICAGFRLTLLRSGCEERRPLLFDFRTAALGALHLALVVFGKSQNGGEFLAAGRTEVLIMRHGTLLSRQALLSKS